LGHVWSATSAHARRNLSFELRCNFTRTLLPRKHICDKLSIMAEKMEGVQMGAEPSKYPVPVET
jgi:hypothetical protein